MDKKAYSYQETVGFVRKAIEDRATWFYLLVKEIKARGGDAEDIARSAVLQFGCLKGAKLNPTGDLQEFVNQFAGEVSKGVFDMELTEAGADRAVFEFNYCPLVEAWKGLGCGSEELDTLCDWAMEGDRGIMQNFPGLNMDIQSRIGAGGKCCRLVFSKA